MQAFCRRQEALIKKKILFMNLFRSVPFSMKGQMHKLSDFEASDELHENEEDEVVRKNIEKDKIT